MSTRPQEAPKMAATTEQDVARLRAFVAELVPDLRGLTNRYEVLNIIRTRILTQQDPLIQAFGQRFWSITYGVSNAKIDAQRRADRKLNGGDAEKKKSVVVEALEAEIDAAACSCCLNLPWLQAVFGRRTPPNLEYSPLARSSSIEKVSPKNASNIAGNTLLITSPSTLQWISANDLLVTTNLALAQLQYQLVPGSSSAPPKVSSVPVADTMTDAQLFRADYVAELTSLQTARSALPNNNPASSLSDYGTASPANWQSDAWFIQQRVLGTNATALTALTPAVQAQMGNNPAIFTPTDSSSLFFMVNYSQLIPFSQLLPYPFSPTWYVPAPIVILEFVASSATWNARGILVDQAVSSPQIIANDGTNGIPWQFAKLCVQAADWNCHEVGNHLTLTHLVTETFIVLTHANLPANHPIFQLLMPHSYATLPLNDDARTQLVPQYINGSLSAFNTRDLFAFAASTFSNWDFQAHYVPTDLANRGVNVLPQSSYEYAATASASWTCISNYVGSVLNALNAVDPTKPFVTSDAYLAQWGSAIRQSIRNFPDFVHAANPTASLRDALTMIIFTATHQHAAVNYFQAKYMQWVPGFPGMLTSPPPADITTVTNLLPYYTPPQAAQLQTLMVQMLSQPPIQGNELTGLVLGGPFSPHYVPWNTLINLFTPFQTALTAALGTYASDADRVSTTNLAQSVLI